IAERVLSDLAHGVRRERTLRIRLPDRELVLVDHSILLARARELDPRHDVELLHRLEQIELADDVGDERFGRRGPGRRNEALRREVEDPLGAELVDDVAHGGRVPEIAFHEADLVPEVLDVLGAAPPPENAHHLHVREREEVVDEMASRETGDPGHQHLHPFVLSWEGIRLTAASYEASTARGSEAWRMGLPTTT